MTNKEVIEEANDIARGVGSSPIIKNNKIIGCVTHVFGNNLITKSSLDID